jgi:filamentous hemagglutinin family protein
MDSPTRIEWQSLTVGNSAALYIISKPDTVAAGTLGHASFHDVTGGGNLNIHGKIDADSPLRLQNASGGNIVIGNRADIYAPDITLTTLRAADPTAYLATGEGRFEGTSSNPASVIANADLLATSGSAQVLGAYVVVNQQGKLEAPSGKVRLFAGPNANVQPASVTFTQLVDEISSVRKMAAREFKLGSFCQIGDCRGKAENIKMMTNRNLVYFGPLGFWLW